MDNQDWLERWQKGETGFNQAAVHDLLVTHWPLLALPAGSRVFVPLCGKSVDMAWLAAQGHAVIGAELSPLAVEDFFREQGLDPLIRNEGAFSVYTAGPIEIWCGDFFVLPDEAVGDIAAVYDRAALVALPRDLKVRYAEKVLALAKRAPIFLVALAYPEGELAGPPFSTPEDEVRSLFGAKNNIDVVEARNGLVSSPALRQRGVMGLIETLYVVRSSDV